MRHLKLILILFVSCCSTIAAATDDYTIYGEDASVANGAQTAIVNIYMTNAETISALEFEITLPEGLDIYYGKNGDGDMAYIVSKGERAKSSHEVSCQKTGDRSYHIVAVSSSNATFKEVEDSKTKPVVSITLDMSKADSGTKYDIPLSECVVSHYNTDTYSSVPYYPSDSQFHLYVGNPSLLGDANGDGEVKLADAILVLQYVLYNGDETKLSKPINKTNADITGDGEIKLNDAIAIMKKTI